MKRARGRPRKFDEELVLQAAGEQFWINGYEATTLDDLSAKMKMNRPSIYRAFGDKQNIYRLALAQFTNRLKAVLEETVLTDKPIDQALTEFYQAALGVYTSGERPKGCMVMSTAVTAAVQDDEIREDLKAVLDSIDAGLLKRFSAEAELENISNDVSPLSRAKMSHSVLHSLSIRARAGEDPKALNQMIKACVGMLTA